MTLKKGVGKKMTSENKKEMMKTGHPKEQATTASLHSAKKGYGVGKKGK
jgi:hypothetical protein